MGGQGLQNAARKTKLNETVKKGSLKGEKVGAERWTDDKTRQTKVRAEKETKRDYRQLIETCGIFRRSRTTKVECIE